MSGVAFFSAPHRVMFAGGTLQSLLAMVWWAYDLGGRFAGLYPLPPSEVPAVWLHALLMIYGVFPFFILGFLMTALPRWVGASSLQSRLYLGPFGLLAAGWGGVHAALWLGGPLWIFLLPCAAGQAWGAFSLYQAASTGGSSDKEHAYAAVVANALALPGLLCFLAGLATREPALVRAAIELGVWGFLLPVFLVVSHRMLPFFSSTVLPRYTLYRSMPLLRVLLAGFVWHGLTAAFGAPQLAWAVDLVLALLAFFLSWKWQFHRSFAVPLLAMHHVATLWLGVALLMYGIQGALQFFGVGWGGLAPLHALTMGYFASMLLGMATRVTLGHSGRTPATDRLTSLLFWAFQAVVMIRLAAEFVSFNGVFNLTWLAALGWLLVFGIWASLYFPLYLRPRADGQAG